MAAGRDNSSRYTSGTKERYKPKKGVKEKGITTRRTVEMEKEKKDVVTTATILGHCVNFNGDPACGQAHSSPLLRYRHFECLMK